MVVFQSTEAQKSICNFPYIPLQSPHLFLAASLKIKVMHSGLRRLSEDIQECIPAGQSIRRSVLPAVPQSHTLPVLHCLSFEPVSSKNCSSPTDFLQTTSIEVPVGKWYNRVPLPRGQVQFEATALSWSRDNQQSFVYEQHTHTHYIVFKAQ